MKKKVLAIPREFRIRALDRTPGFVAIKSAAELRLARPVQATDKATLMATPEVTLSVATENSIGVQAHRYVAQAASASLSGNPAVGQMRLKRMSM